MARSRDDSTAALNWSPRLKSTGRRASSTSESAAIAKRALAGMKTVERIRRSGGPVDDAVLEKLATASRQQSAVTTQQASRSRKLPLAALGLGVVLCTAVALGGWMLRPNRPSHAVAGVMLLDNRPLAGVRLTFHPADAACEPAAAVTTDVGKFAVSELPAGAYKITIDGGNASTRNLPTVYTSAESAVLALNVKQDMHDVRMYARRNYKPSVD